MCSHFGSFKSRWATPIIQGAVLIMDNEFASISLISRRRYAMGGTRFNHRGIDDNGNVANFVETEQIVRFKKGAIIYSFVQIRGTVPSFWKQKVINSQISISKSNDLSYSSFLKHVTEILYDYVNIYMVNLLSTIKKGENLLTKSFEYLITKYKKSSPNEAKRLAYINYDFKADTHNSVSS